MKIQQHHKINETKSFSEILPFALEVFDKILKNADNYSFYLHPLGFHYSRIFHSDETQIRIHVWQKDYNKKRDLYIHDHYYDLRSWVLLGKIEDFEYSVKQSKNPEKHSKFVASYEGNEDNRTIERTDQFLIVKKIKSRIISAGEKYFVAREKYHSNNILFDDSGLTVTIVLAFNYKENHEPNVVGLSKSKKYTLDYPKLISNDDLQKIISKIIEEISKKHH